MKRAKAGYGCVGLALTVCFGDYRHKAVCANQEAGKAKLSKVSLILSNQVPRYMKTLKAEMFSRCSSSADTRSADRASQLH